MFTRVRHESYPDINFSIPLPSRLFNPLHAELNPICHLLTLLGAHHIFHVSGIRVKSHFRRVFVGAKYTYKLRNVRRSIGSSGPQRGCHWKLFREI